MYLEASLDSGFSAGNLVLIWIHPCPKKKHWCLSDRASASPFILNHIFHQHCFSYQYRLDIPSILTPSDSIPSDDPHCSNPIHANLIFSLPPSFFNRKKLRWNVEEGQDSSSPMMEVHPLLKREAIRCPSGARRELNYLMNTWVGGGKGTPETRPFNKATDSCWPFRGGGGRQCMQDRRCASPLRLDPY